MDGALDPRGINAQHRADPMPVLFGDPQRVLAEQGFQLTERGGVAASGSGIRGSRIVPRRENPLDFARSSRVLLMRHVASSIDVDRAGAPVWYSARIRRPERPSSAERPVHTCRGCEEPVPGDSHEISSAVLCLVEGRI
jgi:hypothetical protein